MLVASNFDETTERKTLTTAVACPARIVWPPAGRAPGGQGLRVRSDLNRIRDGIDFKVTRPSNMAMARMVVRWIVLSQATARRIFRMFDGEPARLSSSLENTTTKYQDASARASRCFRGAREEKERPIGGSSESTVRGVVLSNTFGPVAFATPRIIVVSSAGILRRAARRFGRRHTVIRFTTKLIVEQEHEVVAEAENSAIAVALAEHLHPNLVLIDISMTVMTGFEAARQLRERLPDVRSSW